jgi:ABC-type branched-subunit amino acid transport system substrate-binding protein
MRRFVTLLFASVAVAPVLGAEPTREVSAQTSVVAGDQAPVVVLLAPLSGPRAELGRRVVETLRMALATAPPHRMLVLDTAESPASAVASAARAGATVVIGPVGALESAAAIEAASSTRLVVATLAGVRGLERPPRAVRLRLSVSDEVEAACAAITGDPALLRVAAIAPSDAYGDEALATLVTCLAEAGRPLQRFARYEPGGRDFARAIEGLRGGARLEQPAAAWSTPPGSRSTRRGTREAPDALVVLDDDAVVAAALPFFELEGWLGARAESSVALFGVSDWAGPRLEQVSALAAGASVPVRCALRDGRAEAESFSQAFERATGEAPTTFDAEVFDAGTLVRLALAAMPSGASTPDAFAQALAGVPGFAGVCGRTSFESGAIRRNLRVVELGGDGIVPDF